MGITLRVRGRHNPEGIVCHQCKRPSGAHPWPVPQDGHEFDPDYDSDPIVVVRVENEDGSHGAWQKLSHRASLRHVNHSPTGFSWGYAGSGPSQLAFAILEYVVDAETARRSYQRLKFATLARVRDQQTPFEFAIDVERFLDAAAVGFESRGDQHVEYVAGFEMVSA